MLIGDTVNKETNIVNEQKLVVGGRPVGYLQSVQELNSGPPKTNPSSGREEDLNPGPPAYKCRALTTRPRSPPLYLPQHVANERAAECKKYFLSGTLYCVLEILHLLETKQCWQIFQRWEIWISHFLFRKQVCCATCLNMRSSLYLVSFLALFFK